MQTPAISQARRRAASTIGMSMTSDGMGKIELSMKATSPSSGN